MRVAAWMVLVLACLASRPCAADLEGPEKAWAKACVDALASPSERVREGAADALGRLGVDAVPALLAGVGKLTSDAHWVAAERACTAMGAAAAADALSGRSGSWPKAQTTRLAVLVARLQEKKESPGSGAPAGAGVAERVRSILDSFEGESHYSSEEPRVRQIVALGRGAVPALLDALRTGGRWGPGPGFGVIAAADALASLATEEDVDALAALLADGHLVAAKAFKRLQGDRVVPSLLVPVSKGFVDHDLVEALRRHRKDPRVRTALLEWIEAHGADGSYAVGQTASLLAEMDAQEAVALLVPILAGGLEAGVQVEVAEAVVALGDPRGIPALIDCMRESGPMTGWAQHAAGEALNRVVGERIYSGSYGPGMEVRGNAKEAVRRFSEWWEDAKGRLRFDRERGTWVVTPR